MWSGIGMRMDGRERNDSSCRVVERKGLEDVCVRVRVEESLVPLGFFFFWGGRVGRGSLTMRLFFFF